MLTAMGDVMREAYKRGWITTRDGNISVRRRDSFYITPSGGRKTIIHPEHILKAKVDSDKDELVWLKNHQSSKPSGELEMHFFLQTTDDFGGCRSVVHLHPTYCIAAMHAGFKLNELASAFPEVSRYTRVGPDLPVLPVTSNELAKATFAAMTREAGEYQFEIVQDVVGQAGHGVCAIGKSPWDAFEHIERLEHICQIVLASGVRP